MSCSIDNEPMFELILEMSTAPQPILPGSTVIVKDCNSIYNGYRGFVQRISGNKAAVLFEGGNWDKLITIPIKDIERT